MTKRSGLLSRLQIATPCPASWEDMDGSEQVRFCRQCKLNVNVYNLSEMSSQEAENIIIAKEGKLCVRIYRRKDGTILTQDCPVGLRWVRKKFRIASIFCLSVLSWLISICRGEAQDFHVFMKNSKDVNTVNYYGNGPGSITLSGGAVGGSVTLRDSVLKEAEIKLPKISPYIENGCEVLPGSPPQLVLATAKQAARSNTEKSFLQPGSNLPFNLTTRCETGGQSLTNNLDSYTKDGACAEESMDLFFLLRRKPEQH